MKLVEELRPLSALKSVASNSHRLLYSFKLSIIDSTIVGLQDHFFTEPDELDFGLSTSVWPPFFFPDDNRARACSDCLTLTELTRLGEPKCLYGEKLARLGG